MNLETSLQRWIALILPWVAVPFMYECFLLCGRYFEPRLGYFLSFLIYWLLWCGAVPLWLLGKERLLQLFRAPDQSCQGPPLQSRHRKLDVLLLILPPLLAFAFGPFRTLLPSVTPVVALLSAGIALINGAAEELLWRGLYTKMFSERWDLGVAYPTVAFALWHLAPQTLHPASVGTGPFLLSAAFIGACWGVVAWRTGSIRGTALSHVTLDASGFGALVYLS